MNKNADIVLKNGKVFNGIEERPFNGAVAIKNNKIQRVGKNEEIKNLIGENTKVYDCTGKLISPGFNDGHTHITYGAFLMDPDFGLNFAGETDKNVFLKQLKKFADKHPNNQWVYGYNAGWSASNIPNRFELDDTIGDRPVVVQHMDGHSMVVNSLSLEKCKFDENTSFPEGGKFGMTKDGKLDGIMYDDATFMFSEMLYNPEDKEFKRIYRNFLAEAKKFGITAAGELYPTFVGKEDVYSIFKEFEEAGELTMRLEFPVRLITFDIAEYKAKCEKYHSDKLCCKGTKELVDGVITVHTALMLEPYSDDPTTRGCTTNPMDDIHDGVLRACKAGVPVRLHCIGDGAVRIGLDFLEKGEELYGYHGERHGIEHIESCHPDDIKRFKELNVCANMQPMHAVFDTEAEEVFRGDRCKWCWPMRDLLDTGAIISMGTDFPIVGINPFHSLYAAVTRKDPFGKMEKGWQIHQAITIGEALKAHTYGSAYSQTREDRIGSIKEGMLADVIVIDRNLFEIDCEKIKDAAVVLTIFDGKVIYDMM
ncbi:MAG: amidohydrolase [Clostridiales bacterium]|nr:amidohydrolase [Clostridiales bacterium]